MLRRVWGLVGYGVLAGLVFGCAGPGPGVAAGAASGEAQTVRRATAAGAEVRVASFARWNAQCEQVGLPDAAVTGRPGHGELVVRPATLIVGSRRFSGDTDCRDRKIPGVELWYVPAAGYRGTDRMAYRVDAGGGPIVFVATVDVR